VDARLSAPTFNLSENSAGSLGWRCRCRALHSQKGSVIMRRLTAILATTLLASSLFTAAAEARGGGFGGGAHFGGLGAGGHVGGIGGGAFGGGMTGHVGVGGHRDSLGRLRLEEGESLGCSNSNLLHPGASLSPSCG
jgi:hypothetical protein